MKSTSLITLGIVLTAALFIGCAASQQKKVTSGTHPKFETMCSKCHTLDRVSSAHDQLKQAEMRALVGRMAEKPGSGINPSDINDIVREMY